MKLSILICTLESRASKFTSLKVELERQRNGSEEVEILHRVDNGTEPIGKKRNALLAEAKGDFVVFHDDDDRPSGTYVRDILAECKEGIDCIGFRIDCYGYAGPRRLERAVVSNRYDTWATNVDGFRYVRCPHHLVPVRREYALAVGFEPNNSNGEDYKYSMGLQELRTLKNEAFIDKVLYTVYHTPNKRKGE